MTLSPILIFHIAAGSIGLLAGAFAMLLQKGSIWHRKAGNLFFIAVLIVSISAMYMSVMVKHEFPFIPILIFYLLATSWVTIKRSEGEIGRFETLAFLAILSIAICMITLGFDPSNGEKGTNESGLYFFFGGVAALAAALDLNMIVRGGIAGVHRIARHLWRMCFAMAGSMASFLAQERFIPKVFRDTELLWVPILLVLLIMVYWLLRVLFTGYATKPDLN